MPNHLQFEADEYLRLMEVLTEIPVCEDWRPAVLSHLTTAAKMADILFSAPVADNSIDLACRFSPKSVAHDDQTRGGK